VIFTQIGVFTSQMLLAGETFSESYAAVPESVPVARKALTDFARDAGVDGERLQAVRLAASEAITNAILHAYDQGVAGEVCISATYIDRELWVLITDTGHGMRARDNSPGLGLGLALIAQLADEFQVLSRGSGGTELRMRFDLSPAGGPGGDADGCARTRRHAAQGQRVAA
jgi:anti-sigma regulatory factor (Ser/Thr protein kinase)